MTSEEVSVLTKRGALADTGAPIPDEIDPYGTIAYARSLPHSLRGTGPNHLLPPPDRMVETEMQKRPEWSGDFFEGRPEVARSIQAALWDKATDLLRRDSVAFEESRLRLSRYHDEVREKYEHHLPLLKGRMAISAALKDMQAALSADATVEDAATQLRTGRDGTSWSWVRLRGEERWPYEVERFDRTLPPRCGGGTSS